MIKVKPDPDAPSVSVSEQSIGVGSLTRTNFKLQLQREQLLEAEKKEQQRLKVLAAQCEKPDFRSSKLSNQKVLLPNLSTSFTMPSTSAVPMRSIRANLPTNLPSSVLKVSLNISCITGRFFFLHICISKSLNKTVYACLCSKQNVSKLPEFKIR